MTSCQHISSLATSSWAVASTAEDTRKSLPKTGTGKTPAIWRNISAKHFILLGDTVLTVRSSAPRFWIFSATTKDFYLTRDVNVSLQSVMCCRPNRRLCTTGKTSFCWAFIWNRNLCNIINVFIITFDQFKPSLPIRSIHFYNLFSKIKKIIIILTLSFWMV